MTTLACEPVVVAEPPAFSVCRVLRTNERNTHAGRPELAVYTGERSPTGRLRFRVIVLRLGHREYFSVTPDRVQEVVAASLADLDKGKRA